MISHDEQFEKIKVCEEEHYIHSACSSKKKARYEFWMLTLKSVCRIQLFNYLIN